jgi:hypothetical protein
MPFPHSMVGHVLHAMIVVFSGLVVQICLTYLQADAQISYFIMGSLLALFMLENWVLYADVQELRLANARDREAAAIKLALVRSEITADYIRNLGASLDRKASTRKHHQLRRRVSDENFALSSPDIMQSCHSL